MPLPMVHLGIAVRLGEQRDKSPSPEFLLGSISPDAIHMRPDSDREAKRDTHLRYQENHGDELMHAFLMQRADATPVEQSFAAGYVAHILTDQLWLESVFRPHLNQLPKLVRLNKAKQKQLYYQEADQIDFNLYNHAAWRSEVWSKLRLAEAVDLSPLLTTDEIALWQDRTLRWFEELKEEPKIEPKYLSDAIVDEFMSEATVHVARKLEEWRFNDYL